MPCSASTISTPCRAPRKSKCHHDRRNSPSVTALSPISSCFPFTTSRIACVLGLAAGRPHRSSLRHALEPGVFQGGSERSRLPTSSARIRGFGPLHVSLLLGFELFFYTAAAARRISDEPGTMWRRALVAQREFEIAHREPRVLAHDRLGARALARSRSRARRSDAGPARSSSRMRASGSSACTSTNALGEANGSLSARLSWRASTGQVGGIDQQRMEALVQVDIAPRTAPRSPRRAPPASSIAATQSRNSPSADCGQPALGARAGRTGPRACRGSRSRR